MPMSSECNLCPRKCNINREIKRGYCNSSNTVSLSRAALHMWEEPCISGANGSGAIFFAGCNLRCIFCQNHEISFENHGLEVTIDRLSQIMTELQNQGANNINLVTPTHYAKQIAQAVYKAKDMGLHIPILYNTSGYESVDTLRLLDGLIDIYLPDHKYISPELSYAFSNAADYHEIADAALKEMVRQTGPAGFDCAGIMQRGVIVRHLVLPGHTKDSREVIKYLYETFKNEIYISIMSQYTPIARNLAGYAEKYPELMRTVTKREYEKVVNYAIELGIEKAFVQDGGTQKESFIPAFDYEGVIRNEE